LEYGGVGATLIGMARAARFRIDTSEAILRVADDPDDDRILECAIEAASDFTVTRDPDLLRLCEYEGVEIITPEKFLQREGALRK
jgi:uncharacterized protein